ncbi:histidine kinase [Bifidobacterium sp. DSM 109958]|uniref:Sensor-like histidine kinase SenX3 n=1 Tax=Bifidobacterium moraviense TaxID=2675323 RepID=A0A7Y0F3R1_9BIFI|nr:ATP-binding protein [Bifidobacterium sp. DSM 109958]NMN00482.1 histidine kinase [Bifidobacterium sp. DSM 109958]
MGDLSTAQTVAAVVVALLALVVAWVWGYRVGRMLEEEREIGDRRGDEEDRSLFGDDVPVREAEHGLIDVMPSAVVIADERGMVHYYSPGARQLGVVQGGWLSSREVEDIVRETAAAGEIVQREIEMPVNYPAGVRPRTRPSGRGIRAGDAAPTDTLHLRVRSGRITQRLYAVLIEDVSEQRRFEAMRRDFVTNVSHELKTPAGAISLLAETIADAADDPDMVRYFSGRISKESARLTEMVKRLIDLQKAQSVGMNLAAANVSVLRVVREAVQENAVQASAKRIAIGISFNGASVASTAAEASERGERGDATVFVDEESLRTAVKNLVENAVRYSPERTQVGVGVTVDDGRVTIRVVDQGIGIPADSLDRIFERFYRVDPARSRATGGTGLGLAIVKHCVQECGGTISVWSREGEGSTFTIELPTAQAAMAAAGVDADAGDGRAAKVPAVPAAPDAPATPDASGGAA